MRHIKNLVVALMLVASVLTLSACATTEAKTTQYDAHGIADPIEPVNRAIFTFNEAFDRIIFEPVAKVYKAIFPSVVRDSVRSFMRNLKTPITLANNVLQGDVEQATTTVARFAINTTMGICGLFDVADSYGFTYREEDFGQTLATWGVDDGMYLVLPIMGPSSARDAAGLAVDSFADPVRIVTHETDNEWIYYTRGAISGVDTRSRLIEGMDDLRRSSLDFYAAVRSAYVQKRKALVRNESVKTGTNGGSAAYEAFDDFE